MALYRGSHNILLFLICLGSTSLTSCTVFSSAGPSTNRVLRSERLSASEADNIRIIDVTNNTVHNIVEADKFSSFFDNFGDGRAYDTIIGNGDTLDVSIWEAPPALLFGVLGSGNVGSDIVGGGLSSRSPGIPEQMVDGNGQITIPFVGKIKVAGLTPQQIGANIEARLQGKAHQPQVIVRRIENSTANVSVVGEVSKSTRISLTPKGERLLDALASAGGAKQPVGKSVIQLTRGRSVATMPLDIVIRDPKQNIRLAPDDIVTVLYEPFSFIALGAIGASGKNSEIPFEATGLTLAQALGRVGGLDDQRADARGVFIFRLEDPAALGLPSGTPIQVTSEGKVPVIYRVDLKNPQTFFAAQSFPIKDKDVLYVSNAPIAEFQKFVNAISGTILPLATIAAVVP